MLFWIYEGKISGYSDVSVEFAPQGFSLVEGPDLPISDLYFDGKIKVKPAPPSSTAQWDDSSFSWVEMPAQNFTVKNRWTSFLLAIIKTAAYEKIKTFLSSNNPAEYTVLVALLNNSAIPDEPREKLLEGSLRKVKAAMKDSPTPLSSKDVGTINSLLQSELGVSWDING